jgi:hypothetical protein
LKRAGRLKAVLLPVKAVLRIPANNEFILLKRLCRFSFATMSSQNTTSKFMIINLEDLFRIL